ncbi:hypothetical protein NNX39_13750 [Arthrobacter sp. zg-Y826]|uniref:hypothetical protein n=1 Tax=Arthrobacter jinronghuae TaxID=2964609 RepID=UPI0021067FD9|nr:hypothetical protein [Arthrobacter jinronghuae]MCQ1957561.1 hypothetical protein [Arthrobacter jinronghuae]
MWIAFTTMVVCAVFGFGGAVLVMYLVKARQLKRHPLRPQMEVRFSPRGLIGLALLVGVMLLTVCLGLFLVIYRGVPTYAVSVAAILVATVVRPLYLSKAGLPFVLAEIGAELNPKPVPAPAPGGVAAPPQYPGFANAAPQYNAPAGYTAPAPYTAAPQSPPQYNAPAGYTAPPAPGPGKQ